MSLERKACIGLRHTLSVVDDLYGCLASVDDLHPDVLGSSVNGILNQFLDDRCGPLNDLTCGDLIGHRIGQELYDITHKAIIKTSIIN